MQTATKQAVTELGAGSDGLTVASISILAYMLANLVHEGLGHGGACVLSGAKPLVLSSVHFECSVDNRLVSGGGTIANFIAAGVFFLLGRSTGRQRGRWRFFCWIAMTINLLSATGYFLYSGIGGIGDWADFIKGLDPQWTWRIGLTIFGAVGYFLAARLSLLELRPLIGSDPGQRVRLAVRLSRIPYFCGGIVMCIAGALNPRGAILILISAAASTFGGTSGLIWDTYWLYNPKMIPYGTAAEPMPIAKSWLLIVLACCLEIAFIFILGPSVHFAH